MARNDVEIRVVTLDETGGFSGIVGDVRKVESALDDVDAKSRIDGQLSFDFDEVERADRALDDIDGRDVASKVQVDDSEIQRAEREIEGIEDKKPVVKPQVDSGELTSGIEKAFGAVDTSSAGATITSGLSSALGAASGPVAAAAAGLVAVFGDEFITGFDRGFKAKVSQIELSIKTGLSSVELEPIGRAAGDAYSAGFGESLEELRSTAAVLATELSAVDSSFDLNEATRQAQVLSDVMGIEVGDSIRLVRRLVANELVPDVDTGFNLIAQTAQKFQLDIQDIMDVATEFAPVFGRLGVDGAQAFNIIGQTVQEGLLPNVDRAAELFEEFNIEMTDGAGRARPVIEALGLSFEDMQAKLADGRGAEAMAEIAEALLDVGNEAKRNELALALFGASIESASDPERVLELLAAADAVGEVGTAATDAAEEAEEMQTSFDKLGKAVETAGSVIGQIVDFELSGWLGDSNHQAELAYNWWNKLATVWDGNTVEIDGLVDRLDNAAFVTEQFEENSQGLPDHLTRIGGAAEDAADGMRELDDAIANLTGQYDSNRILRSIEEEAESLIATASELETDVYDLATGFDRTTAAGRDLEAGLESQVEDVARLAQNYAETGRGGDELRAGMGRLEASVEAVAAEMGLNQAEAQKLKQDYLNLIGQYISDLLADDQASPTIDDVNAALDRTDGRRVLTTVETRYIATWGGGVGSRPPSRQHQQATGGLIGSAADGGLREGLTLVGEAGPELVSLPVGSMVHSNPDTERMLPQMMGGRGSGPNITINVQGSIMSERDIQGVVADALRHAGIDQFGLTVAGGRR